jgi:hypothetical protein
VVSEFVYLISVKNKLVGELGKALASIEARSLR